MLMGIHKSQGRFLPASIIELSKLGLRLAGVCVGDAGYMAWISSGLIKVEEE